MFNSCFNYETHAIDLFGNHYWFRLSIEYAVMFGIYIMLVFNQGVCGMEYEYLDRILI